MAKGLARSRWGAIAALAVVLGTAVFFSTQLFSVDRGRPGDIGDYQAASVARGRYLATAGNCVTCHTKPGGRPYAGGLDFRTPFGVLYSTNITTDKKTGIGSWSFADFYNAIKYGVRPDGTNLYPAFPYTDFARMTDEDIASLYLFMRTVRPVHAPATPDELRFPYSLRPLLAVWKVLFHDPATYTPDPARSQAFNRGAYLVEGLGHCGACHTPRNLLGAGREDLALTGGVYQDKVRFGHYRKWSAVNLTPAPSGLAAWSKNDIVAYLKHGVNKRSVVNGPMREVVMNSTRHLSDGDLEAIATYLKGIPANSQAMGPAPDGKTSSDGAIVYTVFCGSCHLPTGHGDAILGVSLAKNAIVQASDPSSLINVILYGPLLPGHPFSVNRTSMKMLGKRLSDRDIADVASYVRSSFGNDAGRVTSEQVKAHR